LVSGLASLATAELNDPPRQVAAYRTVLLFLAFPHYSFRERQKEESMAWTTPVLVEICIGLEINGYMPADGYVPPEF
jgi:coenzyme PQQ precursor peptide PqqA